ncbi:hypothetical protein I8F73_00675 [Enterococcus faecalis]|nr:hypothetical protein [Enterococcus faecalis]
MLIQNLFTQQKAITVREAVSVPPGDDEPEGENPGMDRQMKNLLIQMGQQRKGKKMALRTSTNRESNSPLLAVAGGIC